MYCSAIVSLSSHPVTDNILRVLVLFIFIYTITIHLSTRWLLSCLFFFLMDPAPTKFSPLPLPDPLPIFPADEAKLLSRAAAWHPEIGLPCLTVPFLQEVSQSDGLDFATALVHDRLLRPPNNAAFHTC